MLLYSYPNSNHLEKELTKAGAAANPRGFRMPHAAHITVKLWELQVRIESESRIMLHRPGDRNHLEDAGAELASRGAEGFMALRRLRLFQALGILLALCNSASAQFVAVPSGPSR